MLPVFIPQIHDEEFYRHNNLDTNAPPATAGFAGGWTRAWFSPEKNENETLNSRILEELVMIFCEIYSNKNSLGWNQINWFTKKIKRKVVCLKRKKSILNLVSFFCRRKKCFASLVWVKWFTLLQLIYSIVLFIETYVKNLVFF